MGLALPSVRIIAMMDFSVSQGLYLLLILAFVVERLIEVRVSNRNAQTSFAQGGVEYGKGHYPAMVVLHTLFLIACPLEVLWLNREFQPIVGGIALAVCVATQLLRWWVITTLGWRWNTRVIVVQGLAPITEGPFRYLSHPNYLAVIVELIALPMVHNAWSTAGIFTFLNAILLSVRIPIENQALGRKAG